MGLTMGSVDMTADALILRRRDDDKALEVLERVLVEAGYAEAPEMIAKLKRRPLVRCFVLRAIREEVVAGGLATAEGQIDWEAIGEFIKTIAPIIIEIIKMFI